MQIIIYYMIDELSGSNTKRCMISLIAYKLRKVFVNPCNTYLMVAVDNNTYLIVDNKMLTSNYSKNVCSFGWVNKHY